MRVRSLPLVAALCASSLLAGSARATTISLTVQEPSAVSRINDPITSGVPIPIADTSSAVHWALFDGGTEIPLQTTVLSGVRNPWLLLDFGATVGAGASKTYTLVSQNPTVTPSPALTITENATSVTAVTGPLKVIVSKTLFNLFDEVWLDRNHDGKFKNTGGNTEKLVSSTTSDNLPLTTADNVVKKGRRLPLGVSWDYLGPLRATLRIDGYYGNPVLPTDTLLRYTTRITFHAGQTHVTVEHQIRNSFRAYERYVKVKSAKLNVGTAGAVSRVTRAGDQVWILPASGSAALEMIPPSVTVTTSYSPRVHGVFNVDSINGLVLADWSYHGANARFDFCDTTLSGAEQNNRRSRYVDRLFARAPATWYSDRGAFASEHFGTWDDEKNAATLWGWAWPNTTPSPNPPLNYWCWSYEHNLARPNSTYYPGWSLVNSTDDLEADDVWMHLLMYVRVGQQTYLDRADRWARYMAHEFAWRTDGFAYQDASFWNGPNPLIRTRQDLPAGTFTSVDNNYIQFNCHWNDQVFGGKDDGGHTWNGGLVDYYYMTGNRDALAAAIDIAEVSKKYSEWRPVTTLEGGNIRAESRQYLNVLRAWETTGSSYWRGASDYLREMFLFSNRYDARGFYYKPTSDYTGYTIPQRYPNGKYLSPFQFGIAVQALYRDFLLTANDSLRQRLIAMAGFAYQYGCHPDSGYTGDDMVMDSPNTGDVNHHSYNIFRYGLLPWYSYNTSSDAFVDALTIGYRLTGNACYMGKARTLWEHSSKWDFQYRIADDAHVGRWANSLQCWDPQSLGYPSNGDLTTVQFYFHDANQPGFDFAPPGTTTLSAAAGYTTGVVSWMAPGDDGMTGQATAYDLRYSNLPINEGNFLGAVPIGTGSPLPAGSQECYELTLNSCSQYYFALKTVDECGHWSALSNVPQASTSCSPGMQLLCGVAQNALHPNTPDADIPASVEFAMRGRQPAHGPTTIAFGVPSVLRGERLEIAIFDLAGRRVRLLQRGPAEPGRFQQVWDLRREGGATVNSGAYFVRLQLGRETRMEKLLLIR